MKIIFPDKSVYFTSYGLYKFQRKPNRDIALIMDSPASWMNVNQFTIPENRGIEEVFAILQDRLIHEDEKLDIPHIIENFSSYTLS